MAAAADSDVTSLAGVAHGNLLTCQPDGGINHCVRANQSLARSHMGLDHCIDSAHNGTNRSVRALVRVRNVNIWNNAVFAGTGAAGRAIDGNSIFAAQCTSWAMARPSPTSTTTESGIPAEPFTDSNNNKVWDPGEPFTDNNGDGVRNRGEPPMAGVVIGLERKNSVGVYVPAKDVNGKSVPAVVTDVNGEAGRGPACT